ncbi:polyprenyl synthetase family protein [Rubricoccus marinus]|uniref:polyprenyl synthetase family protein n=1 Tax=Rubricoccus marinus TaxID=716817 RepID=UPI000B996B1C|nr:polyprenyl synthetase family protein [Rubricoccus marinus]
MPATLSAPPFSPEASGLSGVTPVSLAQIREPVEAPLATFRDHFRDAMRSDVTILDRVTQYVLRRKGKEIRPTLVLLAAEMCGGVREESYTAAALVELLHTATLVHDDVVDEAETRRGVLAIHRRWKNKVAVLFGDYLLSRGLLLALDHKQYALLHTMSDAVRRMSEGELLQIETARKLDITEETYFRIIGDKTGSLIAACLAAGAESAGADEATADHARTIGEKLGLAFQIRDDLFDYDSSNTGKPAGLDLQDRKMTLPLIAALELAPEAESARIMRIVKKRRKSPGKIREVVAWVHASGGVAAARARMEQLAGEAADGLRTFPPGEAREALIGLCAFVVARKR